MSQTKDLVQVGGIVLPDISRDQVSADITELAVTKTGRPRIAAALHVGGLNHRHEREFVQCMNSFDMTYADGLSVVIVGRLLGARMIEPTPTTDIGWTVLKNTVAQLDEPPRIAILGGPKGLAERAGAVLARHLSVRIVHVSNGYGELTELTLEQIRISRPDIMIVGLGMPAEALWCARNIDLLPDALVLTCGGWLGFIAGAEARAPRWMRRIGFEWLFRLVCQPKRLLPRYARGLITTVALCVEASPWVAIRKRRSR